MSMTFYVQGLRTGWEDKGAEVLDHGCLRHSCCRGLATLARPSVAVFGRQDHRKHLEMHIM